MSVPSGGGLLGAAPAGPALGPPAHVTVTVVQAPACHFCIDARVALELLSDEFPLTVAYVDPTGPQGTALLAEHRPPLLPLVLVDGAFFSAGRLPRRKLRGLLEARAAVAGSATSAAVG